MVPEVVRQLDDQQIKIRDVGVRRSTLDDVFFSLTGRPAESEDGEDELDDESTTERKAS